MELFRRKFFQCVSYGENFSRRDTVQRHIVVFAQEMLGEQPLLFLTRPRPRLRVMQVNELPDQGASMMGGQPVTSSTSNCSLGAAEMITVLEAQA
jgi:hypothetical protein